MHAEKDSNRGTEVHWGQPTRAVIEDSVKRHGVYVDRRRQIPKDWQRSRLVKEPDVIAVEITGARRDSRHPRGLHDDDDISEERDGPVGRE